MWTLKIFIAMTVVMLVAGCATQGQKDKAFENKVKTAYIPECDKSLGLSSGQAITDEQRTDIKWCIARLMAKDELRNGSNDPGLKLIAIWIPNCEAILGADWGEVGSEKRSNLSRCVKAQAIQDIELQNRAEQMMILQGLINSRSQEQIINCYSYGNWMQCK